MQVVVASNCQTGGIAASLRILLPDDEILAFPYPEVAGEARAGFLASVEAADVLVATAPRPWIDEIAASGALANTRLLTAPELYFTAFHPDLVYAWLPGQRTVDCMSGPYNSAIALWAWKHGLDHVAAQRLFTPEILRGLGYLDRWTSSVERLQHDFAAHPGFDHREFLLPLQRNGVFMHSVNHPRVSAVAQLSRMIAAQLGGPAELREEPIEDFVVDGLMVASFVWPVYPPVADALGLRGSYTWKLGDQRVVRLAEYLEASFEMYAHVDPDEVTVYEHTWPQYDACLGQATGIAR